MCKKWKAWTHHQGRCQTRHTRPKKLPYTPESSTLTLTIHMDVFQRRVAISEDNRKYSAVSGWIPSLEIILMNCVSALCRISQVSHTQNLSTLWLPVERLLWRLSFLPRQLPVDYLISNNNWIRVDRILRKDCTYCKCITVMASAKRGTRERVWGEKTIRMQCRFPEQIVINHSV